MTNTQEKVSFGQMVTNLFKKDSHAFNTDANALMHAAVGIIGEAKELVYSTDLDNAIEEAGDLEFYIEAFLQVAQFTLEERVSFDTKRAVVLEANPEEMDLAGTTLVAAAEILDYVKKVWVYHKPFEGNLRIEVAASLGVLCGALQCWYREQNIDPGVVLEVNQEKLAKRYPDGVYSNQHAQARLDKEPIAIGVDSEGGSHD